jgi:hypothetical protein
MPSVGGVRLAPADATGRGGLGDHLALAVARDGQEVVGVAHGKLLSGEIRRDGIRGRVVPELLWRLEPTSARQSSIRAMIRSQRDVVLVKVVMGAAFALSLGDNLHSADSGAIRHQRSVINTRRTRRWFAIDRPDKVE